MKEKISNLLSFFKKPETEAKAIAPKMLLRNYSIENEYDINEVIDFLKLGNTIAIITIKKPAVAFSALKEIKSFCSKRGGIVLGLTSNCFIVLPETVEYISKSSKEKEELIASYATKAVEPGNNKQENNEEWVDIDI